MNLDRNTLLLFSRNRQNLLKRSITLLEKFSLHTIVADGSKEPLPDRTLEGLNLRFVDYYWQPTSLHERIEFLVNSVKTPYASFIDDEDMFLPSSIAKSIAFLDSNLDYVAAGGMVYEVCNEAGVEDTQELLIRKLGRFSNPMHLSDENPVTRICEVIASDRTANLWYQVTRSEALKKLSLRGMEKFGDGRFLEVLIALTVAASGKFKLIEDYPQWIRNNLSSSSNPNSNPLTDFDCSELIDRLCSATKIDRDSARQTIFTTLKQSYGDLPTMTPMTRINLLIQKNLRRLAGLLLRRFVPEFMQLREDRIILNQILSGTRAVKVEEFVSLFEIGPAESEELKQIFKFWSEYPLAPRTP